MNVFIFLGFIKARIAVHLFFLFLTGTSIAQDKAMIIPIDANAIEDSFFLGKYMTYFEEDGRLLSIDDITKKNFIKSEKDILNFGYSTKAVWLRLNIENTSEESVNKVLSIRKALQDTVQFFYEEKGQWKMRQSGQMISEKEKDLPGFSISFPLTLKEKNSDTFYIRMVSKWGKTFAVKLLDQPNYYKNEQKELIICCLLIGVLLTVTTYNFFLARALKDPVYYIYCVAVLSALFVQLYFRGFIKLYVIDDNPFLQEWSLPFIFCFATMCSSYFCLRFLDTKRYSKYADRALKSVIVFNIIAVFYPVISFELFDVYTDARFFSYSAIQFCIVAIYSGIVVYYKGNKSARFLVFGWAIYFSGIILFSLAALDIIVANAFTMNAYLIGSVFEVFMLSSALADRYKQLKRVRVQLGERIVLKEQEIADKDDKISSLTLETLKYIKSKQQITEQLKKISKAQDGGTIKELISGLQAEGVEDKKLELLKKEIDTVNLDYTTKLKERYPKLTKGDMELASLVLLGLTRKEIAILRNISFDAVKKSIHRFRKKIDIRPEESLEKFMISLNEEI